MDLSYTPEQEKLRQQLRDYFAALMTPEVRAALDIGGDYGTGEAYRQVVRQLGRDGWLAQAMAEELTSDEQETLIRAVPLLRRLTQL